jgi:hypothetical protein
MRNPHSPATGPPRHLPTPQAANVGWYLSVGAGWARKHFDPADLYSVDRQLFA